MLNFIDISSWQGSINLDSVLSGNPLHGIIVKATEKNDYVNPFCDKHVQWAIRNNLPWGFYHFLKYTDPVAEAKYFVKHTINYFGDGVPIADYEGSIVETYGTVYLRHFLETVYSETGVKPMVYCNLSTITGDISGFRPIAEAGYKLWLAQWASSRDQIGFNPSPWRSGSVAPFTEVTMHQYTDHGLLEGYNGYLDLDLFYGDVDDWNNIAGKIKPTPIPPTEKADTLAYLEDIKAYIQTKIDELLNN